MSEQVATKSLFASKTFWYNLLMAVALLLTGLLDSDLIKHNPQLVYWFGFAVTIVNIILRRLTDRPVSLGGGGDIRQLRSRQ